MSLLLISLHISICIILCLNCNGLVVNFIPLERISCMSKILSCYTWCRSLYSSSALWSVCCFDATDHSILTHRLQHWFDILSTALNLLYYFLSYRFQTAITSALKSQPVLLEYGGTPYSNRTGWDFNADAR